MKYLIIALFVTFLCRAQVYDDTATSLLLAQSYEQAGDLENAVKLYEKLYESDPGNINYINSLYRVYTQVKNYAALVDILEKRITDAPDDISSYGMLGSTYHRMGNEAKANEIWEEPLKKENRNPLTYRLIADYALERRAFEKAIDLYSRGKEIAEDKIIFSFDLARLYSITMQFGKATEEYCKILQEEPQQITTVKSRIFEYISKPGALDASIPIVENFYDDENMSLQYLLADLYKEKKLFNEALDLYISIDERRSAQGKDLFLFADLLLKEGHYDFASEVYKQIVALYPNSPLTAKAKLGIARSLESALSEEYVKSIPLWKPFFPLSEFESEEIEEVLSAFNEVIELYKYSEPGYEAILRSGTIKFYLQNRIEESKELLTFIIKEAPLSKSAGDAYFELGNIFLIEGNLQKAEQYFSAILTNIKADKKKKNSAAFELAKVYFYQLKFDEANRHLSGVLNNLRDNSANDALELSLVLNSTINDSASIALFAKAEFLANQKKFYEAADIYRKISENQQAFVLHSISLLRLGEMLLAENDYLGSISTFKDIANEGKKNIYADKALYLLGKIYHYGQNDRVKAEEYYQRLLADYPNSIYVDDAREQLKSFINKAG